MLDGKDILAGPGDHIAIPDGAVHAFKALGNEPARLLIINAPGHMHDAFFTGIGSPLPEDQNEVPQETEIDIPFVLAKAEEVGMTIVTPADS